MRKRPCGRAPFQKLRRPFCALPRVTRAIRFCSESASRAELMAERTAPVLAPGAVAWNDNMPAFEQLALALALPLEVEVVA